MFFPEETGRILRHMSRLFRAPCFFLKGNKVACFIRPLPSEPEPDGGRSDWQGGSCRAGPSGGEAGGYGCGQQSPIDEAGDLTSGHRPHLLRNCHNQHFSSHTASSFKDGSSFEVHCRAEDRVGKPAHPMILSSPYSSSCLDVYTDSRVSIQVSNNYLSASMLILSG